jgi:hypothetical protein
MSKKSLKNWRWLKKVEKGKNWRWLKSGDE